jgi:hypothetical protein
MKTTLRIAALALAATATAASAASQPAKVAPPNDDRRMSTVYVLSQAGAILDLCMASPEATKFPEAKSKELQDLSSRLGGIVRLIGTHFRDAELVGVYDATKAQMATDPKLRFHVKNNHQNCGERTLGEMRAYVAENEALIGKFVEKQRLEQDRRPAQPARK